LERNIEVDKFRRNIPIITYINISPEDFMNRQFVHLPHKKFDYINNKQDKYTIKIHKYIEIMKNNKWDCLYNKPNYSIDMLIFFNQEGIIWEGKHRSIALSQCFGYIDSIKFICVLGLPNSMCLFENIDVVNRVEKKIFWENTVKKFVESNKKEMILDTSKLFSNNQNLFNSKDTTI